MTSVGRLMGIGSLLPSHQLQQETLRMLGRGVRRAIPKRRPIGFTADFSEKS
jgi:hypothetical protein